MIHNSVCLHCIAVYCKEGLSRIYNVKIISQEKCFSLSHWKSHLLPCNEPAIEIDGNRVRSADRSCRLLFLYICNTTQWPMPYILLDILLVFYKEFFWRFFYCWKYTGSIMRKLYSRWSKMRFKLYIMIFESWFNIIVGHFECRCHLNTELIFYTVAATR